MGSRSIRKAILVIAALVGSVAVVAVPAGAEQVHRDPGFGSDGLLLFDFDGDYDSASDIAVQPDGRLVVVGSAVIEGDADVVVVRLHPDGSLDHSFGDRGVVTYHDGGHETAAAVALQPDGRIVVAGRGNGSALVLRLLPDGTPDPSFETGGVARPTGDDAADVTVTGDGHILVAGSSNTGWIRQGDLSVVSLRADGSLETGFGNGGSVEIDTGSVPSASRYERANALAVAPDGSITAVGMVSVANNSNTDLLLVRLSPQGAPLASFDGDGVVVRDLAAGPEALADVLSNGDGSVTVAGHTASGSGPGRLLVARVLPSGAFDGGFGTGGITTYRPNNDGPASASSLVKDGAGRLLVAGTAWNMIRHTSRTDAIVLRLSPGGAVDTSFGGGAHGLDAYGDHDAAEAVAVAPGGAIVVAGRGYFDTSRYTDSGDYDADWSIARFVLGADAPPPPPPPPPPASEAPPPPPARSGYWMVGRTGDVYAFGDSRWLGNAPVGARPAVDLEPTPSGQGYWIVDDLGHVFSFGDAPYAGGSPALRPFEAVTSVSSSATGRGYWLFTTMGRVLPFGDAPFLGDMAGTRLNGPVLDSIPTPTGRGYYLVASDGGIFTFGDAVFQGSMGDTRLNAPVQSLVPDGDGRGYWLVASDGGIFSFDAPFRGSMGATRLNGPITGMVRFGGGYLMVGTDGGIFNFSDREFLGSLGDRPPSQPIVSVAALP